MFTTIDCSCSDAVVREAVSVSPNQEAAREPEKDRKWPATRFKLGGAGFWWFATATFQIVQLSFAIYRRPPSVSGLF